MISQNIPPLAAVIDPPPAMQPASDDVKWKPGLVDLDQLKQSYRDAPLHLRALIRGVHSQDELTLHERADALQAIKHTETDAHASCKICHQMPAIPFVHFCKFHSLRSFEMHA